MCGHSHKNPLNSPKMTDLTPAPSILRRSRKIEYTPLWTALPGTPEIPAIALEDGAVPPEYHKS